MNTIGNKLTFKTYKHAGVNESEIEIKDLGKKDFNIDSAENRLKDFDSDSYGISKDIVDMTRDLNNLYRSYGAGEAILDITLDDDNKQLMDIHDIVAEEGEEVSVLLNYESKGDGEKLRSSLVRIHGKKDSKVKVFLISMDDKNTKILESTYAKLEENAQVKIYEYRLGGKEVIANTKADLLGDKSDLEIESIYFAYDEDQLDIQYDMDHYGKESLSDLKINGAMKDKAFKKLSSTLDFKVGSSKSDGSEEENVILLSDEAKSLSVPVLLSGEDDVAGNHAASCGKLDEDSIFYIMSRGLTRSEAESLVINSRFIGPIDALEDEAHKEKIWNKVKEIMG